MSSIDEAHVLVEINRNLDRIAASLESIVNAAIRTGSNAPEDADGRIEIQATVVQP